MFHQDNFPQLFIFFFFLVISPFYTDICQEKMIVPPTVIGLDQYVWLRSLLTNGQCSSKGRVLCLMMTEQHYSRETGTDIIGCFSFSQNLTRP